MSDDDPIGFSEAGYIAPRVRDYLDLIRNDFESRTGLSPDWEFDTLYGQFSAILAARLGEASEAIQAVYDARDPNNAHGVHLDQLVAFAGISRQGATPSTAVQQFDGDVLTAVNRSNRVSGGGPEGKTEWRLTRDVRIGWSVEITTVSGGEDYTVTINGNDYNYNAGTDDGAEDVVQALRDAIENGSSVVDPFTYPTQSDSDDRLVVEPDESGVSVSVSASGAGGMSIVSGRSYARVSSVDEGSISADPGQIGEIATPVDGWSSTKNTRPANEGRDRETDPELRERWFQSLQATAGSTKTAIRAEVLGIEAVETVIVLENELDKQQTVEGVTLPANSFNVIAFPDTLTAEDQREVARAIYSTAPIGIEAYGNDVTATVEGDDGYDKEVSFDFADEKVADTRATISVYEGVSVAGAKAEVRTVVEDYYASIGIGDDVRRLPIFAAIDEVEGVKTVDKLELRFSGGTYAESDLTITPLQYATSGDIVVQT